MQACAKSKAKPKFNYFGIRGRNKILLVVGLLLTFSFVIISFVAVICERMSRTNGLRFMKGNLVGRKNKFDKF